MEYVSEIRSIATDAFFTLPLLIIGFIFFLGTLTSNVGLLLLFLAHLIIVPGLSFIANEQGPALYDDKGFSAVKGFQWIFSLFPALYLQSKAIPFINEKNSNINLTYFLFALVPFIGQFILTDKSVLHFFNPPGWFMTSPDKNTIPASCSMLPNIDPEKDKIYNSPSLWMTHITFLTGFILANAYAVLVQPVAPIRSGADLEKRQAELDRRVFNRKAITLSIIIVSIILYVSLVVFRYKSPCEYNFWYNLFPLIIIAFTGWSFFQFTYNTCGIKPTDILGIVQGMISPNMIDNPIICIGDKN